MFLLLCHKIHCYTAAYTFLLLNFFWCMEQCSLLPKKKKKKERGTSGSLQVDRWAIKLMFISVFHFEYRILLAHLEKVHSFHSIIAIEVGMVFLLLYLLSISFVEYVLSLQDSRKLERIFFSWLLLNTYSSLNRRPLSYKLDQLDYFRNINLDLNWFTLLYMYIYWYCNSKERAI